MVARVKFTAEDEDWWALLGTGQQTPGGGHRQAQSTAEQHQAFGTGGY